MIEEENITEPIKKPRRKREAKEPKLKKEKAPAKTIKEVFLERIESIQLEEIKKPWMAEKSFRLMDRIEDLQEWVETVLGDPGRSLSLPWADHVGPVVAVDTETDGLDIRLINGRIKTQLAGVCLSADGIEGLYIPVGHDADESVNISKADLAPVLQRLFDQSHLVFFNAKFDREILRLTLGLTFRDFPHFEDVQVLSYLHDPKAKVDPGAGGFQSGGLKATSKALLGIEQIELEELTKVRAKVFNEELGKDTYRMVYAPFTWVKPHLALWYAAGDAITTWLLWQKFWELCDFAKMTAVHKLDHQLIDTITWVERQRPRVDSLRLSNTIAFHEKRVQDLSKNLGRIAGVEDFNPGSTFQLRKILFEDRNMEVLGTSEKTGDASTSITVLKELQKKYPDDEFLSGLMDFREYAALHPGNLHYEKSDSTARFYFKQNVVAGGRLAAAGGDYEKDGGCGLNPQAIKKVGGNWWVMGKPIEGEPEVTQFDQSELDKSCLDKDGKRAPNIDGNHIGTYFGECYCMVPGCAVHTAKAIKVDANEVINLRSLFTADPGWTMFSIDYCLAPGTRLLTPDLRWVTVESLSVGDTLVGFDEHLQPYVAGETSRRNIKRATVTATKRLVKPCVKVTMASGTSIVCSEDHLWLSKVRNYGSKCNRGQYDWLSAAKLVPGQKIARFCDPWEEDKTYAGGFLAGVYDGEGYISANTLGCGQKPGLVLERIKATLTEKGVPFVLDPHASGVERVRIQGGRAQALSFLGKFRPVRLIQNMWKRLDGATVQSKRITPDTVVTVEAVGTQGVVAIQTDTHTFVAEGLCSHNCNIEMRVAANVSKEPAFIREFLEGSGDFHTLTATALFPEFSAPGTPKGRTKELRSLAKIINFALLYGGTAYTIHENLNKAGFPMSFEEAEELVNKYWESVPVFADWCQTKRATARAKLLCRTPTGRVIHFESAMKGYGIYEPLGNEKSNFFLYKKLKREEGEYVKSGQKEEALSIRRSMDALWRDPASGVKNYQEYNRFLGKVERVSINIPLQGTAGDLMRSALNRIRMWVQADPDIEKIFRLHLTVHDENDFSVKNEFVPYILPRINRLMKLRKFHEKKGWTVPIETDCEYGVNWDVKHHLTGDNEHTAAAWTEIPGLETYLPPEFEQKCVTQAINAWENDADRVKKWLQQCHPRTHHLIDKLKQGQDLAKGIEAILQLHEFWTADENEEDKMTLADYMDECGLEFPGEPLIGGLGNYLASVPLTEGDSNPILPPPPVPEPEEENPFYEPPPLVKVPQVEAKLPVLRVVTLKERAEFCRSIGLGAGEKSFSFIYEGDGKIRKLNNVQVEAIPQEFKA